MPFPVFALLAAGTLRRLATRASAGPAPATATATATGTGTGTRTSAKRLRALVPALYAELNAAAFNSMLPEHVPVTWNARLRRTAGRCLFITESPHGSKAAAANKQRSAAIELSPRVLDDPERLRSTLAHEMCHAAQWLLDGVAKPPHGEAFRKWARTVEARVPGLAITTRHSYEVTCRFRYECIGCAQPYGRHARLDLERRRCGRCGGALRLLRDGSSFTLPPPGARAADAADAADATHATHAAAPARARARAASARAPGSAPLDPVLPIPAFAAYVQAEYAGLRRQWPRVSHQRLMQTLANKWRRLPKSAKRAHQASEATPPRPRRRT
jgi:predicted SprT family Zn-dependent metalloprotease